MGAQPVHRHGCYQDAPAEWETYQLYCPDPALSSLSPSLVLLPEQLFAWWAAAFPCAGLIASLHILQLPKHCISNLESSLGRKSLIRWGKSIYENSEPTQPCLWLRSCGSCSSRTEGAELWVNQPQLAVCAPPVLRYSWMPWHLLCCLLSLAGFHPGADDLETQSKTSEWIVDTLPL